MSDNRMEKELRLRSATQKAVLALLSIDENQHGKIIAEQCHRIAIDIGNMLAPQICGNKLHGVSNAISVCVRYCSEALFWLNMTQDNSQNAIHAIEELLQCISTPTL